MSVNHSARSGGTQGYLSVFFNMKVCCVFSLESPHRGNSNEYTQHTIFNIKIFFRKINLNYPKSAAVGFFQGTPERVQNSCGRRAISVGATEVLLYVVVVCFLPRWK